MKPFGNTAEISQKNRGKFLTLEGIEGVGKSSNAQWITQCLLQEKRSVLQTREPGGTEVGEGVRQVLLATYPDPLLPEAELLLIYAARVQHVAKVIQPALEKQQWVVCDRFLDATYAYQGAGRGIALEKIEALHHWALGAFFPDYTVILDAPPEVALARIQKNRALDRFEQEKYSFFDKIREYYLSCAKRDPKRYAVVDATKPLSAVQEELASVVKRWVKENQ